MRKNKLNKKQPTYEEQLRIGMKIIEEDAELLQALADYDEKGQFKEDQNK